MRGRRGLAVGAGDGERVAAGQHVFGQPLRAGGVVAAVVEHLLDRGVAARQRIADDDLRRSRRRCLRAHSPGCSAMPSCSSCVDIGG